MRCRRSGLKFGMKLNPYKPIVFRNFHDLHKTVVGRSARNHHSVFFVLFPITVGEFESMSMTFVNEYRFVFGIRKSTLFNLTRIRTEPHRSAHLFDVVLFFQKRNHRIFRVGSDFGGIRVFKSQNVSSVFHDGTLHSKADSQKGIPFVLAY